jgi:hypothetical protein
MLLFCDFFFSVISISKFQTFEKIFKTYTDYPYSESLALQGGDEEREKYL